MRSARTRTLGLAFLTLLTAACGGSGGTGDEAEPLTNADLVGTYFFAHLAGEGTVGTMTGVTGTLVADGLGNAALSVITNEDGSVSAPDSFDFQYEVAPDGEVDFRSGADPFQDGGLAPDGAAALLAGVSNGVAPSVTVLLRQGGLYDQRSLSGAYHIAAFFGDLEGTSLALGGIASFDGAGAGQFDSVTSNRMGVVSLVVSSLTYSLESDGTSTLATGATAMLGGVVEDGAAAVWGGSVTDGKGARLFLALRATTAATDETFQGEYVAVAFVRELGESRFGGALGSATADGRGGLRLVLLPNLDRDLQPPVTSDLTYAVAANGALTTGVTPLRGGVSADGRFAILGGTTAQGSGPTLLVLRRKE